MGVAGGRSVRGVGVGGRGKLSKQFRLDVHTRGPLVVSQGPPWAQSSLSSPQENGKGVGEDVPRRRPKEPTEKLGA